MRVLEEAWEEDSPQSEEHAVRILILLRIRQSRRDKYRFGGRCNAGAASTRCRLNPESQEYGSKAVTSSE
ncbi:hypothetical protein V6N13_123504 [Hibiscus sabdariffa]|uniref:Uncharacterized protein n=1 Tax=Hibiscus sabdariffa TaxID=183260 RepID=A0ABR2QTN8_9ROSI